MTTSTLSYPTFTLHPSVQHLQTHKPIKRRNTPITRKERRRLQRKELEQLLAKTDLGIYILASQLRGIQGKGDSLNVLLCTNHKQIVFHLSIDKARGLSRQYPTGAIQLTPVLAKGAGQGQVGTQFRGCFLRLRPMKSSRVEIVEYVERNNNNNNNNQDEEEEDTTQELQDDMMDIDRPQRPTMNDNSAKKTIRKKLPSIRALGLPHPTPSQPFIKREKLDAQQAERIEGAKILLMLLSTARDNNMASKKRKRRDWHFHDVSGNNQKKRRIDPTLKVLHRHMPKLLRVAPTNKPTPQRWVTLQCAGNVPVSFRVWPTCTAKDILGHIQKFHLFNLRSYQGLYLQDDQGTVFHDDAPLYACGALHLRQVKQH